MMKHVNQQDTVTTPPALPTRPLAQSSAPMANKPWLRSLGLVVCGVAALGCYLWLGSVTPIDPNSFAPFTPFVRVWVTAFLPYAAACVLLLITPPGQGRWRWLELGLILGGAVLMRAVLLNLVPNLSHDSWRYLWDARVFLHGYSPYVILPDAPALEPLRDFVYANSRFRTAPTIYPPAAQYLFVLSYLLAPSNLAFLKGVFLLFDLLICLVVLYLCVRRGLDPARMLLYAWCPLPIVEFALEGHLDGVAIALTLLALLASERPDRRGRILTGFLIGLGTLVKIYPLVLLVPLVNVRTWKRDALLVLTCLLTILVGYLPFLWLGHGQVFGLFASYAGEQGQNAGLAQRFVGTLGAALHLSPGGIVSLQHTVALVLLVGTSLVILVPRAQERLSPAAGALILFSLVFSVSSHVFPWYVPLLLPWIALLLPPGKAIRLRSFNAGTLALGALWIFTFTCVLSYFGDWSSYYLFAYEPLTLELCAAGLLVVLPSGLRFVRKGLACVKQRFGLRP